MPASTNGTANPSEYANKSTEPLSTVDVEPASTRIAPSTGPMQGAAQTAKAAPSRAPEPRLRAPPTNPGATSRSGNGSRPMKASPNKTTTNPATACTRVEFSETELPTSPAPAPSATKRAVNPATNGRLPIKTRRVVPGSPSRPASTAETADRYPGTSGRTQGATNERSPARKATGTCPAISAPREALVEPRERLVEPALELWIHRALAVRRLQGRRLGLRSAPAPSPRRDPEHGGRAEQSDDRQQPREQVETVLRRRGE